MEFDDALKEPHLSFDDIKELLAGDGDRAEADKIDRMTCVEGIADLAFGSEPPTLVPDCCQQSTTTTGRFCGIESRPLAVGRWVTACS